MKLLTYNVNNDYRGNNEKATVVWNIIVGEQVDVVGLQEVTPAFYKELVRQIPDSILEEEDEYFVSECRDLVFITRTSISYRFTPFENSVMNRGILTCDNYMGYRLINTHLESGPFNSEARVRQQEELFPHLLTETPTLLFGDMNFCLPHERFRYPIYYLEPSDISIFSYDSAYNENAIKPYRTMLDRFYSNVEIPSYLTRVLSQTKTTVSDHFPLLLLIRESDVHLSDSTVHPDSR
jgi:endonuclease/exonuclease/phosphatase family metal-dependent hydrolase